MISTKFKAQLNSYNDKQIRQFQFKYSNSLSNDINAQVQQ